MVKTLRYLFAGACFTAGAVMACGPGFLDGISGGTRADGGGTPGAPDTGAGDGGVCAHAEPPAAPGGADPTDSLTLPVFAIDALRVDTVPQSPDAGAPIPLGLDLDHTCTCQAQGGSCTSAADAGSCDGAQGRDDAFGLIFNQLSVGIPLFPTTFATDRIRQGHFTIFADLLGWNGQPNDPQVQVAVRQSQKLDGAPLADGGKREPNFDGNDIWTVDPETIAGGLDAIGKDCQDPKNAFPCVALLRDPIAYVTNNTIVAHPRVTSSTAPVTITLRTSVGVIALNFHDFTLVATISGPVNGMYRLQGELSGSLSATDLLHVFGNVQDFTSSDPTKIICNDLATFAIARTAVCAVRDLSLAGNASAPCDAISASISFGAGPALAGTVYQGTSTVPDCPDAGFTCDD